MQRNKTPKKSTNPWNTLFRHKVLQKKTPELSIPEHTSFDQKKACEFIGKQLSSIAPETIENDIKAEKDHYFLLGKYLTLLQKETQSAIEALSDTASSNSSAANNAQKNSLNKIADRIKKWRTDFEEIFHYGLPFYFQSLTPLDSHQITNTAYREAYNNLKNDLDRRTKTSYSQQCEADDTEVQDRIKNNPQVTVSDTIRLITENVKRFKTFSNHAQAAYRKSGNPIYKRISRDMRLRITAYKNILNDLMELTKQGKLTTINKSNSSKHSLTDQTLKDNFCTQIDNAFYDYVCSKMRVCLGNGLQGHSAIKNQHAVILSALQEDQPLRIEFGRITHSLATQTKTMPSITDFINLLNKLITFFNSKLTNNTLDTNTTLQYQDICHQLHETKNKILTEWSIHLTPHNSDQGEFGYINPHFYLNDTSPEFVAQSKTEKDFINTELRNNLIQLVENNIKEINHNQHNITAKTFGEKRRRILNGSQDNQPNSKAHAKLVVIFASDQLNSILSELKKPDSSCLNAILNINNVYSDILHGNGKGMSLHSDLTEAMKFFSRQNKKNNMLFNRDKHLVNCVSITTDEYKFSSSLLVNKTQKIIKKTKDKLSGFGLSILKKIGTIDGKLQKEMNGLLTELIYVNTVQNNNKITHQNFVKSLLNQEQFINDLLRLQNLIIALRSSTFLAQSMQANALEEMRNDLVSLFVTEKSSIHFNAAQLIQIKSILKLTPREENAHRSQFHYFITTINKKIASQQHKLGNRINLISDIHLNDNPILNESNFNNNSKASLHLDTFKQQLVAKIESLTIVNRAIASGKIASNSSFLATIIGGAGSFVANKIIPNGGVVVEAVVKKVDQQNNQNNAAQYSINTGHLIEWLGSIPQLVENITNAFSQILSDMVDTTEVSEFAALCNIRIESALSATPAPEWANDPLFHTDDAQLNLKRFLIAAIFRQTNALRGSIPREYHYHTQGDKSFFGNNTFENMLAYAGFMIPDSNGTEEIISIFGSQKALEKSKQLNNKLKHNYLETYKFIDGWDDPELFKFIALNSNKIHLVNIPVNTLLTSSAAANQTDTATMTDDDSPLIDDKNLPTVMDKQANRNINDYLNLSLFSHNKNNATPATVRTFVTQLASNMLDNRGNKNLLNTVQDDATADKNKDDDTDKLQSALMC